MCEPLREISKCVAALGIDLLGEKIDIICIPERSFKNFRGFRKVSAEREKIRFPTPQPRMGVVTALVSCFPYAVVGFSPVLANVFGTLPQHLLHVAIEFFGFADKVRNRINYFTIKVELELLARGVAEPHRTRVGVAV